MQAGGGGGLRSKLANVLVRAQSIGGLNDDQDQRDHGDGEVISVDHLHLDEIEPQGGASFCTGWGEGHVMKSNEPVAPAQLRSVWYRC